MRIKIAKEKFTELHTKKKKIKTQTKINQQKLKKNQPNFYIIKNVKIAL